MSRAHTKLILTVLAVFALTFVNIMADSDGPENNPVADVMFSGNTISFLPKVDHSAISLRVTGPDGFVFEKTFQGGAAPFVNLYDNNAGFVDGSYRYELHVFPVGPVKIRRESEKTGGVINKNHIPPITSTPTVQSGSFTVLNGMIVTPDNSPEPQRVNDVVYADDVIIQFSLCVGVDCVNNENFGTDTIRLKENNLRIHFDDTSYSASFPKNDWRIIINDSNNGGDSYFRIEDTTAGRNPFTIAAGAPSNALYVGTNGKVGIGTGAPTGDIHVTSGNNPTLRLEQNGSSGFTAQTWDLAGNEVNFFLRDVTNGSKLPIRVRAGAPDNSIFVANTGFIGLGTAYPNYSLHAYQANSGAFFVTERGDGATTEFVSTENYGIFGTRSNHPVRLRVATKHILEINGSGNYLQVYNSSGTALGNYNGTWNDSSSRDFKENFADLTDSEAEKAFETLKPVKYNYKDQQDDERVGFIAEDVPELVAMKDRKSLCTMDIVALLTKVLKKQQKTLDQSLEIINQNRATIAELKAELEALKKQNK